jgi:hypothetical protein
VNTQVKYDGRCHGGPWDALRYVGASPVKELLAPGGVLGVYRHDGYGIWIWEEKMPHLFDGKPDDRQGDAYTKPGRFAKRYRALTLEELTLVDLIKEQASVLERLIDQTPQGRYASLAMTQLEMAVMWAVKEITQ